MPYNHTAVMVVSACLCALLLLSCSPNEEQKPPTENTKYCVYKEMQTCHSTSQLSCPAGGELSDHCPYSEASSSSFVLSSSSKVSIVYGTSVTYGNETYKTVVIGTQTWFQRNLNYRGTEPDTLGKCYGNKSANCTTYGRLYNWVTAMALPDSCESKKCASLVSAKHKGICPSGWHIPNNANWDKLLRYADGTNGTESPYKSGTASRYLKATSGWYNRSDGTSGNGEDTFGFSALPGGIMVAGEYFDNNLSGFWWTAAEGDSFNDLYNGAYARYIDLEYDTFGFHNDYRKSNLFSVRCVKD